MKAAWHCISNARSMQAIVILVIALGCCAAETIPVLVGDASTAVAIPAGTFRGSENCGTSIGRALQVNGAGSGLTIIDCTGTGLRVFRIANAEVVIQGITLWGGSENFAPFFPLTLQQHRRQDPHLPRCCPCSVWLFKRKRTPCRLQLAASRIRAYLLTHSCRSFTGLPTL